MSISRAKGLIEEHQSGDLQSHGITRTL